MTLLGLDFDNTIVSYDTLFKKLAVEKGLVDNSVAAEKTAIRNHLRSKGEDDLFTLLQGEVYGKQIKEAEPAEGMLETLKTLQKKGIKLTIISHKTKTPYAGPNYDLHHAAKCWLEKNGFFSSQGLGMSEDQVFLEVSQKEIIARIIQIGCTHFLDDLPKILYSLPTSIKGILYDPRNSKTAHELDKISRWKELKNWNEFKKK